MRDNAPTVLTTPTSLIIMQTNNMEIARNDHEIARKDREIDSKDQGNCTAQ